VGSRRRYGESPVFLLDGVVCLRRLLGHVHPNRRRPTTYEELEAAYHELADRVRFEVLRMLRAHSIPSLRGEIDDAVRYAFAEAAIRRPSGPIGTCQAD
jgi:hypothetical protein